MERCHRVTRRGPLVYWVSCADTTHLRPTEPSVRGWDLVWGSVNLGYAARALEAQSGGKDLRDRLRTRHYPTHSFGRPAEFLSVILPTLNSAEPVFFPLSKQERKSTPGSRPRDRNGFHAAVRTPHAGLTRLDIAGVLGGRGPVGSYGGPITAHSGLCPRRAVFMSSVWGRGLFRP